MYGTSVISGGFGNDLTPSDTKLQEIIYIISDKRCRYFQPRIGCSSKIGNFIGTVIIKFIDAAGQASPM